MNRTDSIAYYSHHASRLAALDLKTRTADEIAPFVGALSSGARVLDLGCGSGLDLQWIRKAGFPGTGLEGSPARAALSREMNPGAEILEKNFLFYNPREGEWDGVWANRSLHHDAPEAVQRVVASLFRGLRPGGVFGLVVFEGSGHFEDREGDLLGPSRLIRPWMEKPLCSLLEQTGFQIKRVGRKGPEPARELSLPSLFVLAERTG